MCRGKLAHSTQMQEKYRQTQSERRKKLTYLVWIRNRYSTIRNVVEWALVFGAVDQEKSLSFLDGEEKSSDSVAVSDVYTVVVISNARCSVRKE